MKKQELQQRISLMMNYDLKKTLHENKVSIGLISEDETIDEANYSKIGGESIEMLAKAIEDGLKAGIRDIEIIGKDGRMTKATSTFDVITAAKEGKLTASGLGKVYEGLLKSSKTPANVLDSIIASSEFAPAFNKRWQNYLSKPDVLATKLRGEGYSDAVIQKMITKSRGGNITKLGGDAAKAGEGVGKDVEKAFKEGSLTINGPVTINNGVMTTVTGDGNKITQAIAQDGSKAIANDAEVIKGGDIIEKGKRKRIKPDPIDEQTIIDNGKKRKGKKPVPTPVTNKLNNKWKWALGLLGGGALAWWAIYQSKRERVPELNDCVMGLVDAGIGTYSHTSGGDLVVIVKQTGDPEMDASGGAIVYMNGRIVSKDGKKRGHWKCKSGGTTGTGEAQIGGLDVTQAPGVTNEQLNEQSSGNLNADVSRMIDLLDFPVTGQDLKDARTLLKKYYGTAQAKTFLDRYQKSGLGGGDLLKTLNFIYTSNPDSVENKDALIRMYQEMRDSKDVKRGGKLADYLDITWDGGKKDDGDGGGGGGGDDDRIIPKPDQIQYHDCSAKDLEKGDTLEIGCIHPAIKKLQECKLSKGADLGPSGADGKFGPKLSGLLGGTKVIDKALYDAQMATCAAASTGTTVSGTTVTSGTTSGNTANPPLHHDDVISGDTGNAPQEAPLNVVHPSEPEVTGEQLFKKWVGTYFRNKGTGLFGGKKQAIGQNRLYYKGPDLTQADFDKLNSYLVKNGYEITNDQHAKRYGDKYVWYLKNAAPEETTQTTQTTPDTGGAGEEPAAAQPQNLSENLIKNIVSKHLRSRL